MVRLIKKYKSYNVGDIVAFDAQTEKDLLKSGIAINGDYHSKKDDSKQNKKEFKKEGEKDANK